jgi:putative spermidine/putrescine transport system substrate-binding protein
MNSYARIFAIVLAVIAVNSSARSAEKISYVTAGGVYLDNIKKAFLEPIGNKLDIEWTIETADNDTQVRIQARAGASTYDIVEFGASQCARGGKDGLYEKLDYSIIDVKDFAPGSYSAYYLGSTLFSVVIGYNKKLGVNAPSTWADFWNVQKYPGTRSLRKTARYMLEAAVMADGVEPARVYPLDIDRAIASLRKIKPHIKAWWLSGAESQQLVKDGGIEMIGAFNARLDSVAADGAPVTYTYNQGILDFGCWAIVKGSKKKELAMKILAEFAKADHQADMAQLSNYGAANQKIMETGKISVEVAAKLPSAPENLKKQVLISPEWWSENGAMATERFDQFLSE